MLFTWQSAAQAAARTTCPSGIVPRSSLVLQPRDFLHTDNHSCIRNILVDAEDIPKYAPQLSHRIWPGYRYARSIEPGWWVPSSGQESTRHELLRCPALAGLTFRNGVHPRQPQNPDQSCQGFCHFRVLIYQVFSAAVPTRTLHLKPHPRRADNGRIRRTYPHMIGIFTRPLRRRPAYTRCPPGLMHLSTAKDPLTLGDGICRVAPLIEFCVSLQQNCKHLIESRMPKNER